MSRSFSDIPRIATKILAQFWAHKEIKTQSMLKHYGIAGLVPFCFVKESKILINWIENTTLKKTHIVILPHNKSWFYFEAACSWAASSTDNRNRKLTQREGNRKSATQLTHHSCFQQLLGSFLVNFCFHLFVLIFFS